VAGAREKSLYIAVWDHDTFKSNDFMGAMSFEISDLIKPENKCVAGMSGGYKISHRLPFSSRPRSSSHPTPHSHPKG
jgi:hypothetical protein